MEVKNELMDVSSFLKWGEKTFYYQGEKYYYKQCKNVQSIYYELIAEEIAIDFGIPCAHYDLVTYDGFYGVVSRSFLLPNSTFLTIDNILRDTFSDTENLSAYVNLEDIEMALRRRYQDSSLVSQLMEECINIFLFDVLIGNLDRHGENMGILESKQGISFSEVFDNENMLNSVCLYFGGYSLGIERSDYFPTEEDIDSNNNFLEKFLRLNPLSYTDYFKSKLWIISEENICKILNRVEVRSHLEIPVSMKEMIKRKFSKNRTMIFNVLKKLEHSYSKQIEKKET